MNCQTARQTLELFRPEECDRVECDRASADEAERHVRGCPSCRDAVHLQQQLDGRIGQLCRDVPIPAGLKERLLARVAAADTPEPGGAALREQPADSASVVVQREPVAELKRPAARHRRWLLSSLAAACVVIGAGVSIWFSMRTPAQTIVQDDVTKQALDANPVAMKPIGGFRNSVALQKPGTMYTGFLNAGPLQLGQQDVAVYFFTIRSRAKSYEGRLIVVPVASLKDPPTATSFMTGPPRYVLQYRTTAWVEGKLAYICCLKDGGDAWEKLQPPSV